MSALLDPRRGVVLRPMSVLVDDALLHGRAYSAARRRWGLKVWKDKWLAAQAAKDYRALDRLDRERDAVGLP